MQNRTQAVVWNNYISNEVYVPCGVPQGTLLGPLLFTIYINDVDSCFTFSKLICFADNMIYATISTFNDAAALQADLIRLNDYSRINNLILNPY